MIIEIKVPSPGESISEVEIATWLVSDGDIVEQDQELAEVESDKATLTISAEKAGKVKIIASEGETVSVGSVACSIDTSFTPSVDSTSVKEAESEVSDNKTSTPVSEGVKSDAKNIEEQKGAKELKSSEEDISKVKISPVAHKMLESEGLSVEDFINGTRRITKRDVEQYLGHEGDAFNDNTQTEERVLNSTKMTNLRKKLSQRLVAVKNETAMLTTFNEVDLSNIMKIRAEYKNKFIDTHGVKLGFMGFFIKASALAMEKHPMVNSSIDEDQIVTPNYVDISVAVQTPKGLMVPVIRNTHTLSLAQIESELINLSTKARTGKISIDEMSGGTFTITNGGVFGSMMSTPLINPPQSAILGMHNIIERPIAENGKVVIRPMMYIALSYDHRIIDGKDSVGFLVSLKKMLENPHSLIAKGKNLDEVLLGL